MSDKELERCEILNKVKERRLTQVAAANELGLSLRQTQRLWGQFKQHGASGIVSKKRGKASNHQLSDAIKTEAISLVKAHYHDFKPTFANEKLNELHGIKLSAETLRKLMIEKELWIPRVKQIKRAYQPRLRRACEGELVQIDGSLHDWFEGRSDKCTLLVFIDDATGKLKELRFVYSESAYTYFESTKAYLRNHGKPLAFYSDKLSVFRNNQKSTKNKGKGITQFGRALDALNIEIICANSPQAKGRVERANSTLQDRLVKEMRLRNINTMEEGNAYLPEFMESFNKKFGRPAPANKDIHRVMTAQELDKLDDILCWQNKRTLTHNLTLQYDKVIYMIEDTTANRSLKNTKVMVYDYCDGEIKIIHNGRELNYSFFDKIATSRQGRVVENKHLARTLELIKKDQLLRNEQRSRSCPRRITSIIREIN